MDELKIAAIVYAATSEQKSSFSTITQEPISSFWIGSSLGLYLGLHLGLQIQKICGTIETVIW